MPRITPAGAGKTSVAIGTGVRDWDHPRRCGENIASADEMNNALGSPPQVRGKLSCNSLTLLPSGITPAGAGKTTIDAVC